MPKTLFQTFDATVDFETEELLNALDAAYREMSLTSHDKGLLVAVVRYDSEVGEFYFIPTEMCDDDNAIDNAALEHNHRVLDSEDWVASGGTPKHLAEVLRGFV